MEQMTRYDHMLEAKTPATQQWFAVWTRSRQEHRVCDQLLEKDIEAFLPTITRMRRWKDRRKRIEWPLFPGYCFARFEAEQSLAVRKCVGVANIVSCEGKPIPVPQCEIESLRLLMTSALHYDPCPCLREGMLVEVVRGPLKTVRGRLVRKDLAHARLVLTVDLIGQAVSVNVDAADVSSCAE
jgi:transcription antitermination factor NusG